MMRSFGGQLRQVKNLLHELVIPTILNYDVIINSYISNISQMGHFWSFFGNIISRKREKMIFIEKRWWGSVYLYQQSIIHQVITDRPRPRDILYTMNMHFPTNNNLYDLLSRSMCFWHLGLLPKIIWGGREGGSGRVRTLFLKRKFIL